MLGPLTSSSAKSDEAQPNMVTWAGVGLHVTPRSSQGHNNVKSAKKGKNR